jgi:hypothetical protein
LPILLHQIIKNYFPTDLNLQTVFLGLVETWPLSGLYGMRPEDNLFFSPETKQNFMGTAHQQRRLSRDQGWRGVLEIPVPGRGDIV